MLAVCVLMFSACFQHINNRSKTMPYNILIQIAQVVMKYKHACNTYIFYAETNAYKLYRCTVAVQYTDSTVPTNTVQVPITTGTVTDSGSEYRYWLYWGDKSIYIQGR